MTKRTIHLLTLVLIIGAVSCKPKLEFSSVVTPKQAVQLMDHSSDLIVLDVRTVDEAAEGKLESAEVLDVTSDNFVTSIKGFDTTATYLIYCKSGLRSQKAAAMMEENGFKNLYVMDGGYEDLKALTK